MIIHFTGSDNKWSIIAATVIASFLIIVSEVTAKTLAVRYSEKLSLALARPVRTLISILWPIVKIHEIFAKVLWTIIGVKTEGKTSLVTEEEIRALIKIGEEEGTLHKEKYKMLSKVFEFSETVVRQVMTPKKDIVSIDISANLADILNKALESGYSRLPVYKNNPDNIVGIINMKDLLNLSFNKELILLQDIIYPPTLIHDTKKVTELLREFQKGHTHLAIVIDSQGRMQGLVTLEDLLEEIVGEIEDEYDVRTTPYKKTG